MHSHGVGSGVVESGGFGEEARAFGSWEATGTVRIPNLSLSYGFIMKIFLIGNRCCWCVHICILLITAVVYVWTIKPNGLADCEKC